MHKHIRTKKRKNTRIEYRSVLLFFYLALYIALCICLISGPDPKGRRSGPEKNNSLKSRCLVLCFPESFCLFLFSFDSFLPLCRFWRLNLGHYALWEASSPLSHPNCFYFVHIIFKNHGSNM